MFSEQWIVEQTKAKSVIRDAVVVFAIMRFVTFNVVLTLSERSPSRPSFHFFNEEILPADLPLLPLVDL